jgi:hypothetical protein
MNTFVLQVTYGQVGVFDPHLENPWNDWRNEHMAQGFSWRPGSVSFGTFEEGGPAEITVRRVASRDLRADTVRAIAVPFHVADGGSVEIAAVPDGPVIELPPGHYRLIFEHGLTGTGRMWCDFTFIPVSAPVKPQILRADPELSPPTNLVMTADPA